MSAHSRPHYLRVCPLWVFIHGCSLILPVPPRRPPLHTTARTLQSPPQNKAVPNGLLRTVPPRIQRQGGEARTRTARLALPRTVRARLPTLNERTVLGKSTVRCGAVLCPISKDQGTTFVQAKPSPNPKPKPKLPASTTTLLPFDFIHPPRPNTTTTTATTTKETDSDSHWHYEEHAIPFYLRTRPNHSSRLAEHYDASEPDVGIG